MIKEEFKNVFFIFKFLRQLLSLSHIASTLLSSMIKL